ncbi:phage portal protein [Thermoactinomyces daqus]|uniref:Phage portal protein n=1 Tax=Thermoactinomyces daqus TaxID=1329516 RepID=A0A7W1X8D6_9BACL|nr:phage portal protein [Thermoactinomyces daqus]MBA4541971.1 phage portal protein [Thermoactinomyces daqus]
MGLMSKMAALFRRGQKSPLDVPAYLDGKPYSYQDPTDPAMMLRISWVYACVRIIAQSVKRTPLRVYQGKTDNEMESGPLPQILKRPNQFMSGKQLLEGTATWLELHGNAFWYLSEIDGRGQPKEIWLLDSRHVQVVPDVKEFITGYVYDVNGKLIPLERREVIHFKTFNPFNPFYGLGTLQAMAGLLELEDLRNTYDKTFFENGAIIKGVLKTPNTLSDAAFKRITRDWRRTYGGAKNANKIAIMEEGLEFQPITLSQADMEFLSMAKFNRDRILAAFGVPPAKLGIMENANYSNSEEQDRTFWSETMAPKLADIEERLNNELAPRYGNLTIAFDPVVQEDESQRVQEVVDLANTGILTVDELRERLGYAPLKQDQQQQDQQQNNQQANEEAAKAAKGIRDTFQRSRTAYLARVVKEFEPDLVKFFEEQENRVLEKLIMTGKTGKQYNFIPDELWDSYTEDEKLLAILSVLHITVARAAYEKAGAFFDTDLRFDLENPANAELIKTLGQKITRINETTREAIVKEVLEGMRRGYSINQIAYGYPDENYKGIAGVFEQARGYRARTIARSESADAYNAANLKAYIDLGQEKVEVLDGVDWDEDCRRANGQIWTIQKAQANLKAHPNCVRAFAPYIDLEKMYRKEGPEWANRLKKKLL